jgi:hypothetical protein
MLLENSAEQRRGNAAAAPLFIVGGESMESA